MPMDAVRQKIARSAEHLKAATEEIQKYINDKPGDVIGEFEPNSNRAILKFVAKPVPDLIPIIIGDALQNLRTALDYLVWELVIAANGSPGDKHMFPICGTLDAFNQQIGRGRLDGLPVDAIAEIQGLQPYHLGKDSEEHFLRVLDTLCNINKHRRIVMIASAAHYSCTEIISSVSGFSVQATLTPRYDGAEIAVGPTPTVVGEEVEMKGNAAYFVTFNEGVTKDIEISKLVNRLWHLVDEAVVPKFERFFV